MAPLSYRTSLFSQVNMCCLRVFVWMLEQLSCWNLTLKVNQRQKPGIATAVRAYTTVLLSKPSFWLALKIDHVMIYCLLILYKCHNTHTLFFKRL